MIQTDIVGSQRDKNETVFILLVFYLMKGIGDGLIGKTSGLFLPYQYIAWVFEGVFVLRWCMLDAHQKKFILLPFMMAFLIMFPYFVVPFYFVQTRAKLALRPILIGFLLFFVGTLLSLLGQITAQLATGTFVMPVK